MTRLGPPLAFCFASARTSQSSKRVQCSLTALLNKEAFCIKNILALLAANSTFEYSEKKKDFDVSIFSKILLNPYQCKVALHVFCIYNLQAAL